MARTNSYQAQQQRKAQREALARLGSVTEASADERQRFNAAITAGATVMLPTFNGPYRIQYVDRDFWYHTDGNGVGQSWCGANDGTWASLLASAGIKRNPLFAHLTAEVK